MLQRCGNDATEVRPLTLPRGTVLLIDDDVADLECHFSLLRGLGQEVVACSSHTEAVKLFARETFDLVLVSQGSSAFEGRVVLERALEVNREVPVVVLARHEDMVCYCAAMRLGARDYIRKPVSLPEMRELIERHMRTNVRVQRYGGGIATGSAPRLRSQWRHG